MNHLERILIHQALVALETVRTQNSSSLIEKAKKDLLAALEQQCVCGNPNAPEIVHRNDGPCYVREAHEKTRSQKMAERGHTPRKRVKNAMGLVPDDEQKTESQPQGDYPPLPKPSLTTQYLDGGFGYHYSEEALYTYVDADRLTRDKIPVELWHGIKKVTVYADMVLCSWGANIETEMLITTRTAQAVQDAFEWLIEPPGCGDGAVVHGVGPGDWTYQISEPVRVGTKLYTSPPPSKPLTEDQIFELAEEFGAFQYGDAQGHKRILFARAVEAAHEIKE